MKLRNKIQNIGLVVALCLSFSTSAVELYRPGSSPEETKMLVTQCQLEARKSTASMDPVTYGRSQLEASILGFGKAIMASITQSNIFTLCLKAKGFTDGTTQDSAYSQAKYQLPAGYQNGLAIKAEIPSYVEEGGVTPINLTFEANDPSDPVESVSVIVDSNPIEFRHALTVQYLRSPAKVGLRLRVRFAETTKPAVSAIVTFRSGKSSTHKFAPDKVAKFVSFESVDTLVTLPASTAKLFTSQEIGQQRSKISSDGFLNTIIYHPMFPAIGGQPPLMLNKIIVKLDGQDGEEFLVADLGYAISNNPLVSIYTGNISGSVSWVGSNQTQYSSIIAR